MIRGGDKFLIQRLQRGKVPNHNIESNDDVKLSMTTVRTQNKCVQTELCNESVFVLTSPKLNDAVSVTTKRFRFRNYNVVDWHTTQFVFCGKRIVLDDSLASKIVIDNSRSITLHLVLRTKGGSQVPRPKFRSVSVAIQTEAVPVVQNPPIPPPPPDLSTIHLKLKRDGL